MIEPPRPPAQEPLTADDYAQIADGIEHFIMDGDPEVDAIWQPYVDKLKTAALTAAPRPPAPEYRSGTNEVGPQTICPACCVADPRIRLCHVHAAEARPPAPDALREYVRHKRGCPLDHDNSDGYELLGVITYDHGKETIEHGPPTCICGLDALLSAGGASAEQEQP